MNRAIGLFDSGVGGLTVLDSVRSLLPNENIIYVGDNAHCPYGDKTKEQLFTYASQIIEYFISQNVKMIVLACNTTSANVLEDLQRKYQGHKIIGVIDATVADLLTTHKKEVLVIATEATIRANKYEEQILRYDSTITVHNLATPKLVPLVEDGTYKTGIPEVLQSYLLPFQGNIDALVLGCTHYPILTTQMQEILPDITYISSSDAIGKEVHEYLKKENLMNQSTSPNIRIYTTGKVDEFTYSSCDFFDYTGLSVEHLVLDGK